MQRSELDALTETHQLDHSGVARLLDLARARPSRAEDRQLLERALIASGVLSLLCGVVFFVAANWEAFGVFGRFVLVEGLLISVLAGAWLTRREARAARALGFAAFLLTGTLLALVGQTYQTGADTYELFVTWALLGLPFAIATRSVELALAWLLVFNLGLGLYSGWRPPGGPFLPLGRWMDQPSVLLGVAGINLLLSWGCQLRLPRSFHPWVPRLLANFVAAYACWAGTVLLVDARDEMSGHAAFQFLLVLIGLGALFWPNYRKRQDVFPLATVLGCLIFLSTTAFIVFGDSGIGQFFFLTLWVVGTSTVASRALMAWHRSFKAAP